MISLLSVRLSVRLRFRVRVRVRVLHGLDPLQDALFWPPVYRKKTYKMTLVRPDVRMSVTLFPRKPL